MVRLFLRFYDACLARRRVVAAGLLALIACGVALALRMGYEEDIARFLPRNEQNERFSRVYQNLAGQNRIVVIFHGTDTDSIEAALDLFEQNVEQADTQQLVRDLQVRIDEAQMLQTVQFVYENAPYFMTDADWQHVDSALSEPAPYVARQLEENKRLLQLPTAGSMMQGLRYDPLHLFTPLVKRMQSFRLSDEFAVLDGYVFTQDGSTALCFLTSPFGLSESMHNNELSRLLSDAMAQTTASLPTVTATAVGPALVAVGNANQIKRDSLLAVAIAVSLILVLLVWHYRRLADLLWIGASIGFGWLFAIAGMALFADTVSIIVLGIGSVIIGIAVNYPLHYLDHLQETGSERQTLRDMVQPLLIGNITTVSAFLCLVWLDAQAMRDLGLFGSLMLIGTILFVLVFLPLYARAGKHRERRHVGLSLNVLRLASRRQRLVFAAVVAVLTLFFGYYSLDTSFDSDIRHINFMTPSQQEGLALLAKAQNDASVFAVAQGATLEAALSQNERSVLPVLEQLQQEGVVQRVSGVGSFLPSQAEQQRRAQRWNDYWAAHGERLRQLLQAEAAQQGFNKAAIEPFLQRISASVTVQNSLYFEPIRNLLASNYIQTAGDGTVSVVNFVLTNDEARVKQALGQAPQSPVFAFSSKDIGNQLVQILSDSFNYIGFVCGFVVFFFLWVSFGRLELSLLSFLPLAVSWLWILGIMQLLGIQFNIVNIILATFIFGQGDDYTIFITEGLIAEYATGRQRLDSYKRSVALSAVIMFIGIGTLILAKHPALRSLAEVTIIGMFTVVMMAFYLPPLVFNWLTRKADGSLRPVPLTLRRLGFSAFSLLFFLAIMFLFLLPYTWLCFHLGKATEARKLRFHTLLQRMTDFVIHRVPGVSLHLDNSVGETFERPAVIVCNHQSQLDLMCLMMLTPRIVFLTNDWVWNNPLYGAVIHKAEFLPVSDGIEHNVEPLRSLYERGYSIAVFPEGTRSTDCSLLRFHKGAFYLAEQLGAEVLPIYLHGAGHVLPKDDFMLREGRIDVEVGRRLRLNEATFGPTLLERTKAFRRMYREHFEQMCRRIETPEYFLPYAKYQYMYKGPDTERRARRLLAEAVARLGSESYEGDTITIDDKGQGETALLVALTHPRSQVCATLTSEDDYLVASHLAGCPKNLQWKLS